MAPGRPAGRPRRGTSGSAGTCGWVWALAVSFFSLPIINDFDSPGISNPFRRFYVKVEPDLLISVKDFDVAGVELALYSHCFLDQIGECHFSVLIDYNYTHFVAVIELVKGVAPFWFLDID